jgi:hypothetical protein
VSQDIADMHIPVDADAFGIEVMPNKYDIRALFVNKKIIL